MSRPEQSNRKKINLFVVNSTPRQIANVKFKPQPFYKSIYTISKPFVVYCESNAKLKCKHSQEFTPFEFLFSVPKLINDMIKSKSKKILLQIRFGKRRSKKSYLSEGLPRKTGIYINKKLSTAAKNSPIHFECKNLKLKRNELSVLWPFCKKPYYMMINIVEIVMIEELVTQIHVNNNVCCFDLNTKAKALELMKSSDTEILGSPSFKITLLCPITKLKMKLPSRSLKCIHLQCFDLYSYILLNKIKSKWICPLCKKLIIMNELAIDSFLLDIINSATLPEDCFEITLHANGEWEPCTEQKRDGIEYNQNESDDENSGNANVLMALDDPNYEKNFNASLADIKPILPITNVFKSNKPMNLTIDDDSDVEELPTDIFTRANADE